MRILVWAWASARICSNRRSQRAFQRAAAVLRDDSARDRQDLQQQGGGGAAYGSLYRIHHVTVKKRLPTPLIPPILFQLSPHLALKGGMAVAGGIEKRSLYLLGNSECPRFTPWIHGLTPTGWMLLIVKRLVEFE